MIWIKWSAVLLVWIMVGIAAFLAPLHGWQLAAFVGVAVFLAAVAVILPDEKTT